MTHAGGSIASATVTSGGWREGVSVLAMVLAPIGLVAVLMGIGVAIVAAWQAGHGMAVRWPAPATLRACGLLSYAVSLWIAVAMAWRWSSRRGLTADVFAFRGLTGPAAMWSVAGFAVAMYGVPAANRWLSAVTGGAGHGVTIDFQDTWSVANFVFLFVVTAPVCEEILYRGLLVNWLRRIGWRDPAILCAGSLLFGANHVLPLGLPWGMAMVGFGAILYALRLRCDSLSPGWLTHILFNGQPFLTYPLLAWIAPAALPGRM